MKPFWSCEFLSPVLHTFSKTAATPAVQAAFRATRSAKFTVAAARLQVIDPFLDEPCPCWKKLTGRPLVGGMRWGVSGISLWMSMGSHKRANTSFAWWYHEHVMFIKETLWSQFTFTFFEMDWNRLWSIVLDWPEDVRSYQSRTSNTQLHKQQRGTGH